MPEVTDPISSLFNLNGGGAKKFVLDQNHVTKEEFEAAATMADIIWSADGLAHYLGPAWTMVHDPRFYRVESSWVGLIAERNEARKMHPNAIVDTGEEIITAESLWAPPGSLKSLELYSEFLGEGRHFYQVVKDMGEPVERLEFDAIFRAMVIDRECPNYRNKAGEPNFAWKQLDGLLKAGVCGLIADYSPMSYSADWIDANTGELVDPDNDDLDPEAASERIVVAAEVDNLQKALSLRATVRHTAFRLLRNFPGMKDADLAGLKFTDSEVDTITQALFKADYEKLYTAMPPIMAVIQTARATPYEIRQAEEIKTAHEKSMAFMASMASGELERVKTEIVDDGKADPASWLMLIQKDMSAYAVWTQLQKTVGRGYGVMGASSDAIPTQIALRSQILEAKITREDGSVITTAWDALQDNQRWAVEANDISLALVERNGDKQSWDAACDFLSRLSDFEDDKIRERAIAAGQDPEAALQSVEERMDATPVLQLKTRLIDHGDGGPICAVLEPSYTRKEYSVTTIERQDEDRGEDLTPDQIEQKVSDLEQAHPNQTENT